jgi:hypothetical protein
VGVQATAGTGYVFDHMRQVGQSSGTAYDPCGLSPYLSESLSGTVYFATSAQTVTLSGPTTATVGSSVSYTASGGNNGYTWGGSASGSGASQNVTFSSAGTYTVTVYSPAGNGWNQSNTASVSVTVTVFKSDQTVSSANGSITVGQSFTPTLNGGAGSGAWRWSLDGTSSWNTPGTWSPAISTLGAGSYGFYVQKLGDSQYNDSNLAGPYTLTVNAASAVLTVGVSPSGAGQVNINGGTWGSSATYSGAVGRTDTVGVQATAGTGYVFDHMRQVGQSSGTAYDPCGLSPYLSESLSGTVYFMTSSQTVTLGGPTTATVGASISYTASGGNNGYTWGGSASGSGASQSVTFSSAGTYTVTVYSPAGNGWNQSNTASITVTVSASAPTVSAKSTTGTISAPSVSISANPEATPVSLPVMICWSVSNASSFVVTKDGIQWATTGSYQDDTQIAAAGTYTYTITAQPCAYTATLHWTASNATSYRVTGSGGYDSGSIATTACTVSAPGTYTVTATGPGGTATATLTAPAAPGAASASCTVTASNPLSIDYAGVASCTEAPVVSISASPTTGNATLATTISWNISNASSFVVSKNGSNWATAGSSQSDSLSSAGAYTYSITAQPLAYTATLAWHSVGARSYAVSGPGFTGMLPAEEYASCVVSAPGSYTITAYGTGPAATATIVAPAAPAAASASCSVSVSVGRYILTTQVSGDGTVTAGGTYDAGSWVSLSATPGSTSRFFMFSGDVSDTANPIMVQMTSDKSITASFISKLPQSITFSNPGSVVVGQSVSLVATASSGLPCTLTVTSGSATIIGSILTATEAGPITVTATQSGNLTYLPATPVSVSFIARIPQISFSDNSAHLKVQTEKTANQGNINLNRK